MSVGFRKPAVLVGIPVRGTGASQSWALDGAVSGGYSQDWMAYSFRCPPGNPTLNKVLVYCGQVNGTLGANDLVCDVYSNASFVPNASLGSTNTVTATPTTAGWVEFTGLSVALTTGVLYWIVLRNANATPATNNPLWYPYYGLGIGPYYGDSFEFAAKGSADGGATWTGFTARAGVVGIRLEFATGYFGQPFAGVSTTGDDLDVVYNYREAGVYFTTPANGRMNLVGMTALIRKAGTPTRDLRFRLYQGTTLIDTTYTIPIAEVTTSTSQYALFSTVRTLEPNTVYRAVLSQASTGSGDGSSSNGWRIITLTTQDSAGTRSLLPFGSWRRTVTTDATASPPSFTETDIHIPMLSLILDGDSGEFAAASAGGGGSVIGSGVIVPGV